MYVSSGMENLRHGSTKVSKIQATFRLRITKFAVKVKFPGTEETTETGLKVPIEKYSNVSIASDGKNNFVVSVVGEEGAD